MSKPYSKIIEATNSFFQSTILSIIFVFKSNIYQIGSIFEKSLASILFPLVIIPDAIASLFAIYRFFKAKNKNLGKTFDLILVPIKTALVFIAVFAGLNLIFVQGLFLTAVGSSVIYHLGLSIFHVYHWLRSEKNSSARTLHKNHALNNLIATIAGGIVIAGIVLTMVVAPLLASTFLAIAGITSASLLMLVTVYAIYMNFNSPPLSSTFSFLKEERAENHYSQFEDSSSSTLSQKSETSPPTQNQSFNYYHREFFSEKLTGNQQQDKTFLSNEIDNKILSLQQQIKNSKKTLSEYLWSQEPKRLDKIKSLEGFKKVLNSDNCQITPLSRRASQSFFKETGKLEEFSQAMERYIQLHSSS